MSRGFLKRGLLALLLVAVLGVTVVRPALVHAANGSGSGGAGVEEGTVGGDTSTANQTWKEKYIDPAKQVLGAAYKGGVLGVVVVIASWLIEYAAKIDPFSDSSVQKVGPAIRAAGTFIIGLINIFYILVLLFIAISTILGVERYSIQQMLPRLVIAILLTNFGVFFVYAVAQASQLLSLGLLGPHIGTDIINTTSIQQHLLKTSSKLGIEAALTVTTLGVGSVLIPVVEVIFLLLDPLFWFAAILLMTALILIFRVAGLWVLAIFAPAGVAAGVLPVTQRFAAMYWQKVLAYAFIGPVLIFFLRLAVIIYAAIKGSGGGAIGTLFGYFVTAFTLLIGVMVARKMGVEIANFIIGAFEKGFKGIIGATVAYLKFLYALGKTGAQAALIIGTGGAGLGATAATKLGMSAAQAKTASQVTGAFSGNLKDMFGGKGVMGSVGKFFGKRSDELGKFSKKKGEEEEGAATAETKDQENVNAEAANPANQDVVQGANDMEKNEPAKAEAIGEDLNAGLQALQAATGDLERAVVAFEMAKKGQLDNDNINPVLQAAGIVPGSDRDRLIRAQASDKDMRVMEPNWTGIPEAQRRKFVDGWLSAGNSARHQGKGALQDGSVGAAIAGRSDFDKILASLERPQRRDLGSGIAKAAVAAAADPNSSDATVRNLSLRAVRSGHDPYGTNGIFAPSNAAAWGNRGAARTAIRSQVMGDHNNLVNLDPQAFRRIVTRQDMSPEVAISAMNDNRVQPAAKALTIDYARNPTGPMNEEVRSALRGNSKLAVDRLSGEFKQFSQELGKLSGSVKKAREAAEAAGEAAAKPKE